MIGCSSSWYFKKEDSFYIILDDGTSIDFSGCIKKRRMFYLEECLLSGSMIVIRFNPIKFDSTSLNFVYLKILSAQKKMVTRQKFTSLNKNKPVTLTNRYVCLSIVLDV